MCVPGPSWSSVVVPASVGMLLRGACPCLPCSNNEFPDASPAYGCWAATIDCWITRSAWSNLNALDGDIGATETASGVLSANIAAAALPRFTWLAYVVELDQGYSDVTGIDFWFLSTGSYAPTFQGNLTVWLSPVNRFTASRAAKCVDNLSPSVFAPAKTRVNCTQTPSFTKFVFVQRPVFTGSDKIYLYEMRVVRTGGLPGLCTRAWCLNMGTGKGGRCVQTCGCCVCVEGSGRGVPAGRIAPHVTVPFSLRRDHQRIDATPYARRAFLDRQPRRARLASEQSVDSVARALVA